MSCRPGPLRESSSPPPPPPEILEPFEGEFRSATGTARYELSLERQEFRLYTQIDDGMFLQTHIFGFDGIAGVCGQPRAVEFAGGDRQAGAMPETTIRIALQEDGLYELTRIKPLGGRVGLFEKTP